MNKLNLSIPEKSLWVLFLLYASLVILGLSGLLVGHIFNLFITYTPLVLLLLHACWTLTVKRGLAFIFLAGFLGFVAEALGLNYGTVFGGEYTYKAGASVLSVPFSIIIYWAVFIYVGYWLVTTFLYWFGKDKPNKTKGSLGQLALLVLADGLAVMAIDLFMDPVEVKAGVWSWVHGGPYFGVPVGNFMGWFLVTVLVTSLFRLFEYYRPQRGQKRADSMYILPVLAYLLIGINFLHGAIKYNLPWLAVIGVLITVVPPLANLFLYFRIKKPAGNT